MPTSKHIPSRCRARIDLPAIEQNLRTLREISGEQRGIMAVVKADAYGHGLTAVGKALASMVDIYGVANLAEAVTLRQALEEGQKDIFLLGPALPEERETVVENGLVATVSNREEAALFDRIAAEKSSRARIHVAIDTGMGRIGVAEDDFAELLSQLAEMENLSVEGLMSHFPVADEKEEEFTLQQIERFRSAAESFRERFPQAEHVHIANSAGLLRFASQLEFTSLVRAGLALYGVAPGAYEQNRLQPALGLETEVALVRELAPGQGVSYGRSYITTREPTTKVAVLAAGYGDGYPRHLSNSGIEILIGGMRCPLIGTVTMDQVMVDVSEVPGVEVGDSAVLIGRQGEEAISVAEVADKAGSIPWEIFTGISRRVDRVYTGAS